ncbi:MAG: tRNA pseudouridine(13) synthase TruD [Algisphaera sp.]
MPPKTNPAPLAYLTPDLPGVGGVLKQNPEDFLVEEQPLYEPCGEGEHLYLYIEKKSATTHDLIRRVAKAFRVKRGSVGHAGLKDKHAVTRQHLSIHLPGTTKAQDAEALERLASYPYAQVLWVDRHTNKLRPGHHGGNRFVLIVRDVSPTAVIHAKPILDRLASQGFPNYYGEQRFGYRQNAHLLGAHLLHGKHQDFLDAMLGDPRHDESENAHTARAAYECGDLHTALEHMPKSLRYDRQALDALRQGKNPKNAVAGIDATQRDFLVSATQSAVFNAALDARVRAGTLATLLSGDLAWKHDNRSVFSVDTQTAQIENALDGRVASQDVSPSGPLWGHTMSRPEGQPLAAELNALASQNLTEADFSPAPAPASRSKRRPLAVGQRRSFRERLAHPELSGGVDDHGAYLKVAFTLSRGSFATMVMREIMKPL